MKKFHNRRMDMMNCVDQEELKWLHEYLKQQKNELISDAIDPVILNHIEHLHYWLEAIEDELPPEPELTREQALEILLQDYLESKEIRIDTAQVDQEALRCILLDEGWLP